MSTVKHLLILGGSGFIGSSFLERLMIQGDNIHIHLILRSPSEHLSQYDNITIYKGNILYFNWGKLTNKPDVIYHFARINSARGKRGRKLASFLGSIANRRFLNYLSYLSHDIRLFYMSGSLMYGNDKSPITENHPLSPISFAREYIAAEKPLLKSQKKSNNIQISMIRVPWVLGKESWFKVFFYDYIKKNKKIPLYGIGHNYMSFITITDLSECLIRLLEIEKYHNTIHLSYPEPLTQLDFSTMISKIIGYKVENIELEKYEEAIREAFSSNIILNSSIDEFNDILSSENLQIKIRSALVSMLHDIK